jgi:hypothetical protein
MLRPSRPLKTALSRQIVPKGQPTNQTRKVEKWVMGNNRPMLP